MSDFYKTTTAQLPNVSKTIQEHLEVLDIYTVMHLLLHLPRGYEDRTQICLLAHAKIDQANLFEGTITHIVPKVGRKPLQLTLTDSSGSIQLNYFKTYPTLLKLAQLGNHVRVFGEVKSSKQGLAISHAEIKLYDNKQVLANTLTPVYTSKKGLTQNKIRSILKLIFKTLKSDIPNQHNSHSKQLLSEQLKHLIHDDFFGDLPDLATAFKILHNPSAQENVNQLLTNHPARQRLKLEELTAHQVNLLQKKQRHQANKAPRCVSQSELANQLLADLPFSLTNAQQNVIGDIVTDISTSIPMIRLVQGDVGSGKTLVAAVAACHALDAGWQAAVLAPTEILAEQHFHNFSDWFEPLGIKVGWLSGKLSAKVKKDTLTKLENNELNIVVGTHALFQKDVHYAKLGMVVVDEQHRFGVAQRLAMRDKGVGTPHQLVMTATPIPRTLAMSVYGDMDTSVIDELPPGRTPVTTLTVSNERRDEVIARIAQNCQEGKQAYWVCPLVEDSETLSAAAAESTYALLQDSLNVPVGLVHGKMKPADKQAVMEKFANNEIKLLVATTVIEVGVNVPNASLMVIENAERMGLSQLHQLRGRVGRGSEKSFCVLMYKTPLTENGNARLGVMKASNDGFFIAEEDLKLRGPGELIGKQQSGNIGFYVANLQLDQALLPEAKRIAKYLVTEQPEYASEMVDLWLGNKQNFQDV